ncbi:MAG: hypothetical protein LAT67_13665 [Balneolales bacterium]|nr:hypothetical protein [Balneolales bacterium]
MDNLKYLYRLLFLLPILTLTPSISVNAFTGTQLNGDKDRSSALEFRFGPNFVVGNLNGSLVSFKWDASETQANRLGVSFESGLNFGSTEIFDTDIPDISEYDFYMRLYADRIHYNPAKNSVAFYLGYGPRLGFGFDRSEEIVDDTAEKMSESTRQLEIGFGALTGVEWRVAQSLSLSAEYQMNARYAITRQTAQQQDVHERSQKQQTLRLAGTIVRLSVAVYF